MNILQFMGEAEFKALKTEIIGHELSVKNELIQRQQSQITKLEKERIEWIAVTSEMESEINELKAGEDWYKNRLSELDN